MADPEALTVTPSPAPSSASFDRSSTPSGPPSTHFPLDTPALPPRSVADVIQAGQIRCGICFSWLDGKHTHETIEHINACWKEPKARARTEKRECASRHHDLAISPAEEAEDEEDHFHDFDLPNMIPEDDEETTESTSSSSYSIFAEPLSPWSPPPIHTTTTAPPTFCILCKRDLSSLDDLDALQHRVFCVADQEPRCCPVCDGTFYVEQFGSSVPREPQHILKHLHACQNDGDTDDAARLAFENLLEAWRGRREMLVFLFNHISGRKKNWKTQQNLWEYVTKRDQGRERGRFERYLADVTPLRRRERILPPRGFVVGAEVEVEILKKEEVPDGVSFDRFKRSAFHILFLKGMAQVPRNFKEQNVVKETVARGDSIAFWSRLKSNPAPAPALSSSRSHLSELREGSVADEGISLLMKGAAAENFPAIGDRPSASRQSRPRLRHPSGITHPTMSMDVFDAILRDDTPYPSPTLKPTLELSEDQKQLMDLFSSAKERADQLLLDAAPTPENTMKSTSVTLPRPVERFRQLAFTNTPDAPSDADQNAHSLLFLRRSNRNLDPPLYGPQLGFLPQPHRDMSDSSQPPRNMSTTPIRLPPTEDSAVQMARRESLQNTAPLMLPSPYAHTLFFHDGSMIVFGDGVVPPSPNAVLEASLSEAGESQDTSGDTPGDDNENEEQKGHEEQQTATSPALILPPSFPRTHHPSLRPSMFLNPPELDEEDQAETYDYSGRGAIPTSLRSNLRTVVDPRLSAAEQAERNRQCCVLNFGSVGQGVQMLSEEKEVQEGMRLSRKGKGLGKGEEDSSFMGNEIRITWDLSSLLENRDDDETK